LNDGTDEHQSGESAMKRVMGIALMAVLFAAGTVYAKECCDTAAKSSKPCFTCHPELAKTCCDKATVKGKACAHGCCKKAVADGKTCAKCDTTKLSFKATSCCGKAQAKGKACTHPCCVKAQAGGKACAKCNG
jgi:hypothetical protein